MCQILRLKCTKFDFRWGSAPDPAGGAYSAPPDLLAGFKAGVVTSKGREEEEGGEGKRRGRGGEGEEKGNGKGRREGGKGEEGKGRGQTLEPPLQL